MTQTQTLLTACADFYRLYSVRLNRLLAAYNLPAAQWAVLKRLYHMEPPTLVQLAKVHCVEAPTMTTNVKKLVRHGYVETATGADRRHKTIMLTEKGRALYEESQLLVDAMAAEILAGVPEEDLEAGLDLFIRLKSKLLQLP